MKKTVISAFAALAALAPQLAFAGSAHGQAPSALVQYADIDIRNEAGAEELWARIHSAARNVCGAEPTDLHDMGKWDDCVLTAEKTALARVNSPLVSRIAGIALPSAVRTAKN